MFNHLHLHASLRHFKQHNLGLGKKRKKKGEMLELLYSKHKQKYFVTRQQYWAEVAKTKKDCGKNSTSF